MRTSIAIPLCLLLVFQVIYNSILKQHVYPIKWRTTIVNAIFKNKGTRKLAQYFRGISIVYLMAKIFDFIMLNRFKQWFIPSDQQTAYQEKLSCADHVFLERCLIAYARKVKEKLFLISIDFDGAFDRVSRSVLIRKLCKFGAGTLFVTCIASMYLKTDNVIFQGDDHIVYTLYAGIKQGLPLSPLLFLFYINDIFCYFQNSYANSNACNSIFELIHLLVHADDATIIASTREKAVSKLRTLLEYCKQNWIIPQFSKCEFIAVNGMDEDVEPLPFGEKFLKHVRHLNPLGSHLSATGKLVDDLKLHMDARYKSCIKYYNFLRANQFAPLIVKVKVLKACVVNSLLYNCETFGHCVPKELERMYTKLIRSTFNVRANTPALLLYVETGFLPIKALVLARQYKFFSRYKSCVNGKITPKVTLFNRLMAEPTDYIQHYIDLCNKYENYDDIYKECINEVKTKIRELAQRIDKYKFTIYSELNPELQKSSFITQPHPLSRDIIRFRLGSHSLPIETGRWARKQRADRKCIECGVLGDERHALFTCPKIDRSDLTLPNSICDIWNSDDIFTLVERMKNANILD